MFYFLANVICELTGNDIFPHYVIKAIYWEIFGNKMRVLGFTTNLSEICILRKLTQMYRRLHVKYLLFLSDLIELNFLNRFLKILLSTEIKIVSGNRITPRGRTDRRKHKHYKPSIRFSQICVRASTPIQNKIHTHKAIISNILCFLYLLTYSMEQSSS